MRKIEPSLLTASEAAGYLGVSKTYFEENIRPFIPVIDMKAPESKKEMPRWSRADLDAFVDKRRVEKKAS